MEQLFNYSTGTFIEKMKDLHDEACEAYSEYLYSDRIPYDRRICFTLLKIVYTYVMEIRSKRDRKTATLLHCLYSIASSGEVLFMRTAGNDRDVMQVKRTFPEDSQHVINMAILAGMTLVYYYRVFEERRHTAAYSKEITSGMNRLMTVNTSLIDKVKAGIEEEKPLPIRIKEYLDTKMEGHDTAKKTAAMAIYRFMEYGERMVFMLEGSTGVGKTFFYENLASCEFLNKELTFYSYTAPQLTPNGFTGDSVENMLRGYRLACSSRRKNTEIENPDKGIIFLD